MTVIDPALLALFRGPGRCEYCGRACKRRECHHVYGRGMGGGQRLDVRINLIALGGHDECNCHALAQSYKIPRCDILAVVAAREGRLQPEIEAEIHRLRRLPKGSRP